MDRGTLSFSTNHPIKRANIPTTDAIAEMSGGLKCNTDDRN